MFRMSLLPLTYTYDAATCPTLTGRRAEAVGGRSGGETDFTPPITLAVVM